MNLDSTPLPEDLLPLIEAMVNGTIDDEGFDRLQAALIQSAEARRLYRRYVNLHAALSNVTGDQPRLSRTFYEQVAQDGGIDLNGSDIVRALAELAWQHEQGGGEPVVLEPQPPFSPHGPPQRRNQLKARLIVAGSLAAAIALSALVALVVGWLDRPSPTPPIAQQPEVVMAVVATLTFEQDAAWVGDVPQVGDPMYPGQTLELSEGFAEITTRRGAKAILQAPCTIEFIDNPNALLMHEGKLVGVCETDSSKGFLVRTSHMDITDLGTRFGVDVSMPDTTEVHVFEGEVQAARPGSEQVLLAAHQSAQASAGTSMIAAIDYAPDRFAAIREESGLGRTTANTVFDTDLQGTQWLITTSEKPGSVTYQGNLVTCTVDNSGFIREVVGGNAYRNIQHRAQGAGVGMPATATGRWRFSNLPVGRYDVATAFHPRYGARSVRFAVNGAEVFVDQSAVPRPNAGPTFKRDPKERGSDKIFFKAIGSSIAVPEGGSIVVTIDNANNDFKTRSVMDCIAITLVPEADTN